MNATLAPGWREFLAVPVLYFLGCKLGMLTVMPEGMAIVWPPNSVLLSVLILFRGRAWLRFSVLVVAAEVAADLPTFSLAEALLFGLTNVAEASLAWRLLARWRFDPALSSLAELPKFLLAGPLLAALAAAFAGAGIYSYFRDAEASYFEFLRVWWFGDGMGLLIFTPLLLAVWPGVARPPPVSPRPTAGDAAILLAGVLMAALVAAAEAGRVRGVHLGPVLLLPFALYVAARFDLRATALAVAATALLIVVLAVLGQAPFGTLPARAQVIRIQEFIFILSTTALGLGALLAQLRRQNAALELSNRTLDELTQSLETRIRERTEQLEASNRELELFAYAASHDLQAPLRGICGLAGLLDRHYREQLNGEGLVYLRSIQSSAKEMNALIEDLLRLARVNAKQLEPRPVALDDIVAAARRLLHADLEAAGAQIECGPLPTVRGDARMLTQLFQNLMGNAIKFRRPGAAPRVRVEAQPDGARWRFAVADNGIGIPQAQMPRLFGMFQRLYSAAEYPGTGLGLALCKKVVQLHGGDIWAESREGEGSTFHFTLPGSQDGQGQAV